MGVLNDALFYSLKFLVALGFIAVISFSVSRKFYFGALFGLVLQFWLETDKAAYLLRQYFFNNLHDRLSTRPFLSLVEKKWLAFQVMIDIYFIHLPYAVGVGNCKKK